MKHQQLFKTLVFFALLAGGVQQAIAQDTLKSQSPNYGGGFAIYPLPNKPMLGYRGSIAKKKVIDIKLGYAFTAGVPQINLEINRLRRTKHSELLNFYRGLGFTLEGFNPGIQVPLGFEIKPLQNLPNFIVIAEIAPKFMISAIGGYYAGINGTIGVVLFKQKKPKKLNS